VRNVNRGSSLQAWLSLNSTGFLRNKTADI